MGMANQVKTLVDYYTLRLRVLLEFLQIGGHKEDIFTFFWANSVISSGSAIFGAIIPIGGRKGCMYVCSVRIVDVK